MGSDMHAGIHAAAGSEDLPLDMGVVDNTPLVSTTDDHLASGSEAGSNYHRYISLDYDADDEWDSSDEDEGDETTLFTHNNPAVPSSDTHQYTNGVSFPSTSLPFELPGAALVSDSCTRTTPSELKGISPHGIASVTPSAAAAAASTPSANPTLRAPIQPAASTPDISPRSSTSDSSPLFSALRAWFDMPSPSDPDFNFSDSSFEVPSVLGDIYTSSPSMSSSWLHEDAAQEAEEEQGVHEEEGNEDNDDDDNDDDDEDDEDDLAMANFWLGSFWTTPAGIAFMVHEVEQELDDLRAVEFDALMGLDTDGEVEEYNETDCWDYY
ncbi:hypothetical protein C8A03DRAFT_36575 [Achaetomium macrosporum]|uniref:Uncharacterized protein n=1 Tax=Achaetomium macrosporum TaxID=79813 RepID=A0AAN7H9K4_9PEZI|nr:hypothetical protein C8A03DRAFT_36575 [Achaetomium macrosporum]